MTPHRQLLADYAESGSEEAFRELVTSYIGLVHGSALRLVDGQSQLAEDIAQTVFTDLARQAKKLSPEIMMGGWLHRRTCYAAANVMRSERRRLIREREAVEMNALNSDAALAWATPVLDEAINQLADDDRDAITLRFFERWNLRAIGEAMGTTEAAAQKRVERALEKLRGLLMRRGVVLSAAAVALAVGSATATAAPAGLAATISTAALTSAQAGAGFTLTTLKIMAVTKLKITAVAAVVALLAAGTATTIVLNRDPSYNPPPHPNPQKILYEAEADATAGRYKEALAKQIWYRNNALRYQPAQVGVRDSFALMYWSQLAEKYPPAMKKLLSIRDDATKQLRDKNNNAKDATADFITAVSVNNGLKEEAKNVELFKWLDTHNPAAAKQVYAVAERDLIQAGEYALCGRYMEADRSYQQILMIYNQMMKSMKQMPKDGRQQFKDVAEKMFSNQCARLVAVLAINNRIDDADWVAVEAGKELNNPEFAALLTEAKNGTVPPKWP
jgi:RNA polymerase sigma factor (sigma-70 family)